MEVSEENKNSNEEIFPVTLHEQHHPKFLVIAVIAVIFAFISVFIFVKNYAVKTGEFKTKTAQLETLKQENNRLATENDSLKRQIDYLNTKSGVESVAREKLGLIKSSEVAFVVVKDQNKNRKSIASSAPTPAAASYKADESQKNGQKPKSANWLVTFWNSLFSK